MIVEISGNHGLLYVHAASGHIVSRVRDGDGYDDILWFDPTYLSEDTDILTTAPVYRDGTYAAPMFPGLVQDAGEAWWFYQPLALLPAPKVTVILHGWVWSRYWDASVGDEVVYQEHAEAEPPDGWCVYTRREGPVDWRDPSDFDISNDQDFATYEEALAEATQRAADYGIEHFED